MAATEATEKDELAALENEVKKDAKKKTVAKKKETKKKAAPAKTKGIKVSDGVVGTTDLLKVNPKKLIVVTKDNPRIDYGDLTILENSIKERGVENPVRVKRQADGTLKLVAGYRRVRACLNLIKAGTKIHSIPAVLEKSKTTERETLIHVFVENDGKPFTIIEEAKLFSRMKHEQGMDEKEIGKSIGRSPSTIVNRIALLKSSPELQDALQNGLIKMQEAERIARAHKKDHKKQAAVVADYIKATKIGGKEEVKAAKKKVAKETGADSVRGITQHKAKTLLDDITTAYIKLRRSKKPVNDLNKDWVALEKLLKKAKKIKRTGEFK